jgi:hypothetical protein
MKLKKFSEFVSIVSEDNGYPMGAEYDPRAPWKRDDQEEYREIEMSPSEIKFKLISWDGEEHALVEEKSTGKIYLVYVDSSDGSFRDFVSIPIIFTGSDGEGGRDYEKEEFDERFIDDTAIESYATYKAKEDGIGVGMEAWEDGKVSELNDELASYFIEDLESYLEGLKSGRIKMYGREERLRKIENFLAKIKEKSK